MGAQNDPGDIRDADAHAQFQKFALNLGAVTRLGSDGAQLSAQLLAQYAPVALFGIEQINLGGLASVRGYRENLLAGDSGYVVRTELGQLGLVAQALPGTVSPYIHFDYGRVALAGDRGNTLSSAGLGLRWNSDAIVFESVLSSPFRAPVADQPSWLLHLSLGVSL